MGLGDRWVFIGRRPLVVGHHSRIFRGHEPDTKSTADRTPIRVSRIGVNCRRSLNYQVCARFRLIDYTSIERRFTLFEDPGSLHSRTLHRSRYLYIRTLKTEAPGISFTDRYNLSTRYSRISGYSTQPAYSFHVNVPILIFTGK